MKTRIFLKNNFRDHLLCISSNPGYFFTAGKNNQRSPPLNRWNIACTTRTLCCFICRPFRKRVLTAMNIKVDGDWSINSSLELLSSGNSLIIYDRNTGTTFLSSPVHVCGLFTEIRYGYKIWRAWKSPDYFSFPGKRVDPVI